jgi:hypothetical protein
MDRTADNIPITSGMRVYVKPLRKWGTVSNSGGFSAPRGRWWVHPDGLMGDDLVDCSDLLKNGPEPDPNPNPNP